MNSPAKKILVVDDDFFCRRELEPLLKSQGYNVVAASGGEEGPELLEREKPDLMILDLNMPGMTGFEVLEKIRRVRPVNKIPIVMVLGDG